MTQDEAKETYRQAWMAWCMTQDPVRKQQMEKLMDDAQLSIAKSPKDPEWEAFAKSLPGFLEFWQGWAQDQIEP